jgi:alanine dehydrogenase
MTEHKQMGFEELAKESVRYPQEQLAKVKARSQSLFIGLPKEISLQENRVSLTPEAVSIIVNNGHEVWVETKAGAKAKYDDNEYSEAGAIIVDTPKEIYQAQVILKIEPPTLAEIDYMKPNQVLISALQVGNKSTEYFKKLSDKKVIALAYEYIEDKVGGKPIIRAMSEVAGSTVMQIAAEYLSTSKDGLGVILGGVTGVPPTNVVILGGGTVAEYAARGASGLGADIKIFDNHIYKLRRIKHSLPFQIFTSTLDSARLGEALAEADVLIGAIRPERGRNRVVVTEEMVMGMKPGAVIVDLSIDQGGCVETSELTTHDEPTFVKHGIIHYCVPNVTSRVARTASSALSNIFTPTILRAGEEGSIDDMIFAHSWFMNGVYTYKGGLSNRDLARRFGLPYKDIALLRAARI